MKAYYDIKPSKIESVGNGSYRYRYEIQETESPAAEDGGEHRKVYSCQEVTVWAPLSANKITLAVIADRWDADHEKKLINEYNAVQMGIIAGEEAEAKISAYKDFLRKRQNLKSQVDADFAETISSTMDS